MSYDTLNSFLIRSSSSWIRDRCLFCLVNRSISLFQRVTTRPRTTDLSMSVVSPSNWSAHAWAEHGERGTGGALAIMAPSCSTVMGKAGVLIRVGPSLGDSMDIDKWAGEADMF